jgi:hypothetical protein
MSKSLLECVMETVQRALAIEGRRDKRAIDLWKRMVVELLPSLGGDFGHVRSNAGRGLFRLVASPNSTGRYLAQFELFNFL